MVKSLKNHQVRITRGQSGLEDHGSNRVRYMSKYHNFRSDSFFLFREHINHSGDKPVAGLVLQTLQQIQQEQQH